MAIGVVMETAPIIAIEIILKHPVAAIVLIVTETKTMQKIKKTRRKLN